MTDRIIIDARELAELLHVPVSTIRRGFGPPSLSGYGRRRRWRRSDVLAWIANLATEAPCPSTNAPAADSGTTASSSTGGRTRDRLGKSIDERLSRSNQPSDRKPSRHLAAIKGGASGS